MTQSPHLPNAARTREPRRVHSYEIRVTGSIDAASAVPFKGAIRGDVAVDLLNAVTPFQYRLSAGSLVVMLQALTPEHQLRVELWSDYYGTFEMLARGSGHSLLVLELRSATVPICSITGTSGD